MTHIIFDMDGLLLNTMVSNRRVSEYISSDICSGFLGGGEGVVHTDIGLLFVLKLIEIPIFLL